MKIDKEKFKECTNDVGDYFTGKYIFQPLGRFFAKVFIHTPMTPNQITWFWAFLMVISALLFATGNYWCCVGGGALWICAYAMDFSDGIVARYKNLKSPSGEFLDYMVHLFTYPLLMTCIGWCVYKNGGTDLFDFDWWKNEYYILFGIAAGIGIVGVISILNIYEIVNPKESEYTGKVGAAGVEGTYVKNKKAFELFMNVNPLSFTNMMVLLLVFAVIDQLWLFIICYAVGYMLAALGRAYLVYRKLAKIRL